MTGINGFAKSSSTTTARQCTSLVVIRKLRRRHGDDGRRGAGGPRGGRRPRHHLFVRRWQRRLLGRGLELRGDHVEHDLNVLVPTALYVVAELQYAAALPCTWRFR
jgi:hypothetical protein